MSHLINNQREIDRLSSDLQDDIIKALQAQLKDSDINFTFDLSNSFQRANIGGFKAVISNNKYAGLVDGGMLPNQQVNFDKLRIWVEGKLKVPQSESYEATVKIYQKIRKKGIRPTFFVKKALKTLIGVSGVSPTKKTRKKTSKFGRKLSKILKTIKKITRQVKKITKVTSSIKRTTNTIKRAGRKRT